MPYQQRFHTSGTTLARGVLAFVFLLAVMSTVRFVFLMMFGGGLPLGEALPAFTMGLRIDLKWLALTTAAPALIVWFFGLAFKRVRPAAAVLFTIGAFTTILFDIINIGFYKFYGTPISSIIFGFLQDDTKAIIETIWKDWPVWKYVGSLLLGTFLPILAAAFLIKPARHEPTRSRTAATVVFGILVTLIVVACARGGFSKFPLRQQDLNVSTNPFINAMTTNGPQAMYEASKAQKALSLGNDPETTLKELGFKSAAEAEALLEPLRKGEPHPAPAHRPDIVFALMESMSRDMFDVHDAEFNNTLGALEKELSGAHVFRNAFAVHGGTFPSLEGLLFDTPLTPLSQSKYGHHEFSFSKVLPFKKAGYRIVFITAGSINWRHLDETLPRQGFDEIYGEQAIMKTFPEAPRGVWGVPDEYMFRFAERYLDQTKKEGVPVLIFMLSITNHGPHIVPSNYALKPIDMERTPAYVISKRDGKLLEKYETFQYSTNALGEFVGTLRKNGSLADTLVVATGDHNARIEYAPGRPDRNNGVPVIFWVPEAFAPHPHEHEEWVSHRDVFPTLKALALGGKPALQEGRDVFGDEKDIPATAFVNLGSKGMAASEKGIVSINRVDEPCVCYHWHDGVPEREDACSGELERMARIAAAQAGLADYTIRRELIGR